jgi:hypothetical protein
VTATVSNGCCIVFNLQSLDDDVIASSNESAEIAVIYEPILSGIPFSVMAVCLIDNDLYVAGRACSEAGNVDRCCIRA